MRGYERDYLDLLNTCIDTGTTIKGERTGVGTRRLLGQSLTASDVGTHFPVLTTRPVQFKIAFWETMMFLNGITDTKFLEDKGINIWKGNTTREFLDARGLKHLPEGDMGLGYGHQWRCFGFEGVDQVKNLLEGLAADPFSRRHLVTAWNPAELDEMALPPCHIMHQYFMRKSVINNCWTLDSLFYMRSVDMPFGLPFNMMSYSFLNVLFAKYLSSNMPDGKHVSPGNVTFMGGDCHIYNNQIDMVDEQLRRVPMTLPTFKIVNDVSTIDKMMALDISGVELGDFSYISKIKSTPKMAV